MTNKEQAVEKIARAILSNSLTCWKDLTNVEKEYWLGRAESILKALKSLGMVFKDEIIKQEQERMTKCLRELYKKGWTLADVIEAEDTLG